MSDGASESILPTESMLPSACAVTAAEFDFQNKIERTCTFEEACAAMQAGRFAWIDVDVRDQAEAQRLFDALGVIEPQTIESALKNEPSTQHARFDDYIHLVVSGCRQRGGKFDLERVDVVIGERFLVTVHRGPVAFLSAVRRDYRSDFMRLDRKSTRLNSS